MKKYPPATPGKFEDYDRDLGITGLLLDEPAATEALYLLSHPVRKRLEPLLLADCDLETVALVCAKVAHKNLSKPVIGRYRQYFWDTRLLTRDEIRQFLLIQSEYLGQRDDSYFAAMDGKESLMSFWGVPFDLKAPDAFREIMTMAFVNLKRIQKITNPTRTDALAAESWMRIMVQAHTARSSNETVLVKIVRALERFLLEGDSLELSGLKELIDEEQGYED